MILIGMFDSPFVRRVAVTLNLLDIRFEHRDWSVGKDFHLISEYNPLGRVPTLVLHDGDALIDSAVILDYLDEAVGPERALLPRSGEDRRAALRIMAIAVGTAEKGVLQLYEEAFRPAEKRHPAWIERCVGQMHAGLAELERIVQTRRRDWLVADRLTQADVTATCVYSFLRDALQVDDRASTYPGLAALAERCEVLAAFQDARAAFFSPAQPG